MNNFTMRFFRLFVLFVVKDFVIASANDMEFEINAELDGFTCPEKAKLFEEDKFSKIQCFRLCSESKSCFGAFYDQVNLRCVGCGVKFLTCESAAPSLNETRYYQRLGLEKTYVLVDVKKSWDEAKVHCQELGGHLVDIKSDEERQFIDNQLISAYPIGIWIGAHRKNDEGPFYWLDDTALAGSYGNWMNGQPNNYQVQNCVLLSWENPWKWNDYFCTNEHESICEYEYF